MNEKKTAMRGPTGREYSSPITAPEMLITAPTIGATMNMLLSFVQN